MTEMHLLQTSPYQTDYITAKTGAIDIGPFDIDTYIKDTVLDMGVVNITNGFLTDYQGSTEATGTGYYPLATC